MVSTLVARKRLYVRGLNEKQHGLCFYCDVKMIVRPGHSAKHWEGDRATLDHIIPKARGGGFSWRNLVLACADCNRLKEDREIDAFNAAAFFDECRAARAARSAGRP